MEMPTDIWSMEMPTDILNHNLLSSHVKVHIYICVCVCVYYVYIYIYIYIYGNNIFHAVLCVWEIWSVIYREKLRLTVIENTMLRETFGCKGEEVT